MYGRGGPVAVPRPVLPPQSDGTLNLAAGGWRVQRESLVTAGGERISAPGFQDKDWMIATVPGTVLTSYLNDGAIANPDFGDNQYTVSDSFFCADFWYRDEFTAPAFKQPLQHMWLDFDGINWEAEVYLNGQKVGRIDGGYMRGQFDVTALVHPGATNALAVRILRNANPGGTKDKAGETVNGGALGRDNPTYHASAGWDWMSTIRGRNTGIWGNVSLHATSAVQLQEPLVTTTLPLPDTTHADVAIQATLRNLEPHPVTGTLRARFGTVVVETPVTLDASETKTVAITPATQPALRLANPKLWWPVGYGEPNLYPVTLSFLVDGKVSDTTSFETGIRQFTYSEDGGVLKLWINGRRFIAQAAVIGDSPSRCCAIAHGSTTQRCKYHRDEHFNMIRNWVGQTGDEAFYEAADRNGVVVWQDFWLANPWDGPDPDDNDLFLQQCEGLFASHSQPCFAGPVLRAQRGVSAAAHRRRTAQSCRHTGARIALHLQLSGRPGQRPRPLSRRATEAITSNTRRRNSTARWARPTWWIWTACAAPCPIRRCGRRAANGRCTTSIPETHSRRPSIRIRRRDQHRGLGSASRSLSITTLIAACLRAKAKTASGSSSG